MREISSKTKLFVFAISLSLYPAIACAMEPVNTVHTGPVITGGTYFNTPGGQTTFTNTSGGLWLKSGSNLRGVEVNTTGNLTNNGGVFLFSAPGQVIRLDGNIDVRGIRDNSGAYLGNGGKVFVNSAYLYQSGNIYANGINGGQVQFNVGSVTLRGTAHTEAKGESGLGGIIGIQASNAVSLARQSVLDSSGKVAGSVDANVISIEGSAVNLSGLIQANGIGSSGGSIVIKSTQGDVTIASSDAANTPAMLVANGGHIPSNESGGAPPPQKAGDGGTIQISAQHNIQNGGWLLTNGGSGAPSNVTSSLDTQGSSNGGTGGNIQLVANCQIESVGRIVSDGGAAGAYHFSDYGFNGGNGGLIKLKAGNSIQNNGVIRAMGANGTYPADDDLPEFGGSGGNGGKVIFQSFRNPPQGNGIVATFGGFPTHVSNDPNNPTYDGAYGKLGSITAPNPRASTNKLYGSWVKSP